MGSSFVRADQPARVPTNPFASHAAATLIPLTHAVLSPTAKSMVSDSEHGRDGGWSANLKDRLGKHIGTGKPLASLDDPLKKPPAWPQTAPVLNAATMPRRSRRIAGSAANACCAAASIYNVIGWPGAHAIRSAGSQRLPRSVHAKHRVLPRRRMQPTHVLRRSAGNTRAHPQMASSSSDRLPATTYPTQAF